MSEPHADLRIAELTALNEISKLVNSTLELDDVMREIVRLVCINMRVDVCSIYLIENRNLVLKATQGLNPASVGKVRMPVGQGITGTVAAQGRPVAISNAAEDPRFLYFPETGELGFSSILSAPMISRGAIIGVINVQTAEEREFEPLEVQFLTSVAGQVAGAIRNSQLYQKATRSLHELITLNEVGKIISSTLERDQLLRRICEVGTSLLSARGAILRLQEGGRLILAMEHHEETEALPPEAYLLEEKVAAAAAQTHFPQVASPDEHNPFRDESRRLGNLCFIAAPIVAKNACIGALSIYREGGAQDFFSVSDRRLLVTLSSQASVAIENAHLFESVQRAQRELSEAQERLVAREKLAALGEMATGVAHELRNPLVSIGGFARRIAKLPLENVPEAQRKRLERYVGIITGEVQRLEHLVDEMLRYAAPAQPNRETVAVDTFIAEALAGIDKTPYLSRGIRFKVEIDPAARHFHADPAQLRRALLNLISNGCDAMPLGGQLRISARPRSERGIDYVELEVADQGHGIDPEVLHRVFDPFFTTKASGTGLGLSITKSIVESNGGRIWAESREGEGSTFRLWLPAQAPPLPPESETAVGIAAPGAPESGGENPP